ncbi:MAG: 50S ribosomal protein L11 methyltransferase [Saccharofermentanales bacterium]
MEWIELKLDTTSEAADAICEKLIILGASGVTVEDPSEIASIINAPDSLAYADEGYVDSLGDVVHVKAYFAKFGDGIRSGIKDEENKIFDSTDVLYQGIGTGQCSVEELLMLAENAVDEVSVYLDTGKRSLAWSYIADEDWANCWKKYYKPIKISDRAVISPSWESYPVKDGEFIISLDPGSAFGTGTHATTAMCAQLLDQELLRHSDLNILDLGCGSGILSIIAAKLGARHVDAIDIDQIAVDVTRENCRINDSSGLINCTKGEIHDVKGRKYDIVIANIIAEVICHIASEIPGLLTRDGVFIAGGIICTRKDSVLEACRKAGLLMIEEKTKDDWISFLFKKDPVNDQ